MSRTLQLCSLLLLTIGCGGEVEEPAPPLLVSAPPPPPPEVPEESESQPEASAMAPVTDPPDIILILADDMGAGDWQVSDPKLLTPHLMRLVDEGVRLDRYYTLPLCTPTRTALMTGRSPLPFHMAFSPLRRWETRAVPKEVEILPQLLKEAGYSTGLVGKWHLGHREPWMLPNRRGFDYFYGFVTGAIHYYTHRSGNAGLDWQRNGESLEEEGYSTTLFGEDASKWIAAQDPDRPYFLYLPFNAPHTPMMAPEEFTKRYKESFPDFPRRRYCGMIGAMDDAIGEVLAAVEARGNAHNTMIVFVSDNGGSVRENGSNGELRGSKGTVFEGAIRTPGVIRWPARLPAGVVSAQLVDVRDWFPTALAVAGATIPDEAIGRNVIPALAMKEGSMATEKREDLFYATNIASYLSYAVIRWPYKGIVRKRHKTGRFERRLYRLDLDPNEQENLREAEPGVMSELEATILAWFEKELPGEDFARPLETFAVPMPEGWEEPEDWTVPPPIR